ncbi:uncharacterized protein LOC62_04G005664 [Vanrija pseudolonga]|uniref:Something about silencing protein 4 domain-containing protein n=1 Tax=Vanrija pseudolonga TaxID=143232 RepID=A0AAF0Y926_9TREE|nr:hypothetical protein LOC62_04G005664 [Vanrija pseudolonga]
MPARASPRAAASGPDAAPGAASSSGSSNSQNNADALGLTHLTVPVPGSSPAYAASDASSSLTPTSTASPVSVMLGKHKGKARAAAEPERGRRVLPARIRRAAGGGAEGIRDIEEMVVDWLERWGDINTVPPDDLPLQLTTLPYALVTPPIYTVEASTEQIASRTASPTRNGAVPDLSRIETPEWRMVRAGEDDREEAKEELASGPAQSPTKRLRRGNVGSELVEDVSDQHYALLHRKFEAFERRQRIREREKLQFERYKMRARVDLLRSLPAPQWTSVVTAILARTDAGESWSRGRRKLEAEGVDWLRRKLIKEGVEVLRRYDQLLPNDKKQRLLDDSRVSTPSAPSAPSSLSPPPRSTPDPPPAPRVSALRDEGTSSSKRRQRPTTPVKAASPVPVKVKVEEPSEPPPKPVIRISALALKQTTLAFPKLEKKPPAAAAASPRKAVASPRKAGPPPAKISKIEPVEPAALDHDETPPRPPSPRQTRPRFVPPQTASGLPCLIEAAQRREKAIEEAIAANAKVEAAAKAKIEGKVLPGRLIARKKTRESTRITQATPFGLPMPASLDTKSEFSLSDEEDFWAIIAAREAQATEARRKASTAASTEEVYVAVAPPAATSPSSDALDMEGVEAAVVL